MLLPLGSSPPRVYATHINSGLSARMGSAVRRACAPPPWPGADGNRCSCPSRAPSLRDLHHERPARVRETVAEPAALAAGRVARDLETVAAKQRIVHFDSCPGVHGDSAGGTVDARNGSAAPDDRGRFPAVPAIVRNRCRHAARILLLVLRRSTPFGRMSNENESRPWQGACSALFEAGPLTPPLAVDEDHAARSR